MNQQRFIFSLIILHLLGSISIYPMKNKRTNTVKETCNLEEWCCDSHPNDCRFFYTKEEFDQHIDAGVENYIKLFKSDRKNHLKNKKKEEWSCPCPWQGCKKKSGFYGSDWTRNLKKHVTAKHGGVKNYRCLWDNVCNFNGVTRDQLSKHIRAQHLAEDVEKKENNRNSTKN